MPIFEYRCAACGGEFENLQFRNDEAAPPCPRCGGKRVERLLSVFAVPSVRPATPPGPCGSADCACRRANDDQSGSGGGDLGTNRGLEESHGVDRGWFARRRVPCAQ